MYFFVRMTLAVTFATTYEEHQANVCEMIGLRGGRCDATG